MALRPLRWVLVALTGVAIGIVGLDWLAGFLMGRTTAGIVFDVAVLAVAGVCWSAAEALKKRGA